MLILMTHAIWGLVSSPHPANRLRRDRVYASTRCHKASFLDSASDTVPNERSGGASSQACDHDGAPRQARRDGRVVCPHGCSLASCERGRLDRKTQGSPITPPPPPRIPVDPALIPGRAVEPIDLVNSVRLAGARDLDIAIARQRILQAAADLKQVRLWLPSLFYGPAWYRADGQIQIDTGQVETIERSSLFLGATRRWPTPSPPIAGDWLPFVNGLSTTLRISDAIFEPMAARRGLAANQAGLQTATNDALLRIAEAYFDLQAANGRLAIAREAVKNAEALSTITEAYARLGQGLEADHRRAMAELKHRQGIPTLPAGSCSSPRPTWSASW